MSRRALFFKSGDMDGADLRIVESTWSKIPPIYGPINASFGSRQTAAVEIHDILISGKLLRSQPSC